MKIKFSHNLLSKKLPTDLETLEFDDVESFNYHIENFTLSLDYENNVYCCWHNNRGWDGCIVRDKQWSLLLTHEFGELNSFIDYELFENAFYLDLHILQFSNYQEALQYCIQLKEGF
jgi:hypothetical protein